jgi:hypothetical protein
MLLINNQEVEKLFDMKACLEALVPHRSLSGVPDQPPVCLRSSGASITVSSCFFTCSINGPVTVRNSTLISAFLPGSRVACFVEKVAVPRSFPSAAKAFPATLIRPKVRSVKFCTVPLMWRWLEAQIYIPGSIPGCRPTVSTSTFTLSFISAAKETKDPADISSAITSGTIVVFTIPSFCGRRRCYLSTRLAR